MVAASAQLGASVAGQGLDPVWSAAQARGALRVGTDFGFTPFTGLRPGPDGDEPFGYDIDLARAIGAKLGLDVVFVPTSLEGAYDDLSAGKMDMVVSALPYAPEQGWRARFSTFYFNAGQVLLVQNGSPVQASDQLGGLRVGVPLGSDADTLARRLAREDASISVRAAYDTPTEVAAALRRGDIDAAILDNAAALIALGAGPGLRFVPPAFTLEPYAIGFPAVAYQLQDQVNRALEQLRREEFFEQNGRKWFG